MIGCRDTINIVLEFVKNFMFQAVKPLLCKFFFCHMEKFFDFVFEVFVSLLRCKNTCNTYELVMTITNPINDVCSNVPVYRVEITVILDGEHEKGTMLSPGCSIFPSCSWPLNKLS